jgi:hypothetical protein
MGRVVGPDISTIDFHGAGPVRRTGAPQVGHAAGTVQAHLAHVFAKLGVASRTQLAKVASKQTTSDA